MSTSDLHANKGPVVLVVSILMVILAVAAVALRFLSRKLSKAIFWWDDWIILAALVRLRANPLPLFCLLI